MLARFVLPVSAIAISNSRRRMLTTLVTPSCPAAANPYKYGRPISTARAPRASALSTSVPRRIPPSTNAGTRPATFSTTGGSASAVAGRVEIAATVIGHDNPRHSRLDRAVCILRIEHTFYQQRNFCKRAQPLHILPTQLGIQNRTENILPPRKMARTSSNLFNTFEVWQA